MKNFDELLKKYADFIVRVGVNPQPGQVLIINCALEGAPLARLCVRSAFEAGARDVQVNWTDDAVTRTRMELGSEEALTDHKGWQLRRYLDYAETEGGVCVLHLIADDPEVFAGLEKALDALLTGSGARDTLLCSVTAQGTLRTGEQVQHLQADSGAVGVRLTLSRSVQRAAEAVAAQTMTTGCILVLDVRTAALRACVSVPGFDPADPAASLEAPDSPFLNRALQAYAVGSVFKPVLAAAALEAGLAPEYDCNGAVVVDGQIFRCAGGVPHGEVDLLAALAKSCNGYFIRLGQQLGAQALLQQAQALGFGRSIGLAEGLTAQSGVLPGAEELAQSGQLANFSFGQGSLLATPLQVAAMMNTIANGGVYRAPCLLDCALDETSGEELSAFARPQAERVLTEQTAAALRTMLEQTVAEGTAQDASGLPGGAAGKTGTAQTGQFTAEGKERMNLWFAGFYPAEDPQYTIVVLQDGQTQAAVSSAAVFAQLCTALHWLG